MSATGKTVPLEDLENWFDLAHEAVTALDSGEYDGVRIDCYDREEVHNIRRLIPPQYRDRVGFTWLERG